MRSARLFTILTDSGVRQSPKLLLASILDVQALKADMALHQTAPKTMNRRHRPFQGCPAMQLTGLESAQMIDVISVTG